MPYKHFSSAGQSLYVMFDDADDTAVDLTAGAGNKDQVYEVSDADLVAAGLPPGDYLARVFFGSAASKSSSDTLDGVGSASWTGANVISTATQVTRINLAR